MLATERRVEFGSPRYRLPESSLSLSGRIKGLKTELGQYSDYIDSLIGPHSREMTRQAKRILDGVVVALDRPEFIPGQGCKIQIPYKQLGSNTDGTCLMKIRFLKRKSLFNQSHAVIYPEHEEEWFNKYGLPLTKRDAELLDGRVDYPTASIYLPKNAKFPSWIAPHGLLRINTHKIQKLHQTAIGYDPEHEARHTEVQVKFPKAYFWFMDELNIYDESLAESAVFQAFRREMVGKSGQQLPRRSGQRNKLVHNDRSWVREEMVRNHNQQVGDVSDHGGPAIQTDMNAVPYGLEWKYIRKLFKLGRVVSLMTFDELMGTNFDERRYPQYMCFALFMEDLLHGISGEIFRYLKDTGSGASLSIGISPETVGNFISRAVIVGKSNLMKDEMGRDVMYGVLGRIEREMEDRNSVIYQMNRDNKEELLWKLIIGQSMMMHYQRISDINKQLMDPEIVWQEVWKVINTIPFSLKTLVENRWLIDGPDYINKRLGDQGVVYFKDWRGK